MFIQQLIDDPVFYASAVVTLIVSVVLHELAHGWVAIWQGDDTPIALGHMTPNPLTHMGPVGFGAVFLVGLGWGAMPVNAARFRHRYGDTLVSLAGPGMNLLLALLGLTVLGLWRRWADADLTPLAQNMQDALWVFGYVNVGLAIFNLAPIPPLDGSRVLADVNRSYANWLRDHAEHHHFMFAAYFILILVLNRSDFGLWHISANAAGTYLGFVIGV